MTDQQFCLRWNNHQSTLVAVFDGLLEKGVLVDCTLAAEGQQLTAHKVVLAACSPFLETLLSRHYDKHPILILKDVKFAELKAMMDYMYRGEVNISQDQLGTFLKAAESLQIKGLSDGGGGDKDPYPPKRHHERKPLRPTSPIRNSIHEVKRTPPPPPYLHNSMRNSIKSTPLLVDIPEDNSPINRVRDGSLSPVPRKKKRPRESEDPLNNNVVAKPEVAVDEPVSNHHEGGEEPARVPSPDTKLDPALDKTDPAAHLKHELIEEEEDINEDSEFGMDDDEQGEPGTSHNEGDFKGDFFSGTQDGDNRDGQAKIFENGKEGKDAEIRRALSTKFNLLNDQDFSALYSRLSATNGMHYGHFGVGFELRRGRNGVSGDELSTTPQWGYNLQDLACLTKGGTGTDEKLYSCSTCKKKYRWKSTLRRHEMVECGGKEPAFQCPQCPYRAKQRGNLGVHMRKYHAAPPPSLRTWSNDAKSPLSFIGNNVTDASHSKDLDPINLLKASWEAWRAATHVQDLSKAVRHRQRELSPVSLLNLSNLPSSPVANGAESPKNVECGRCGRRYKLKSSLRNHQKWECGKEPRFQCPYCVYRAKQKMHVERHIERMHKDQLRAFYDGSDTLLETDVSLMFDKMKNLSGKMLAEVMSESIRQA